MSIEFNENHLREITENSDRSKSNSARISDLEDDVKAIKEENKEREKTELKEQIKQMQARLKELDK